MRRYGKRALSLLLSLVLVLGLLPSVALPAEAITAGEVTFGNLPIGSLTGDDLQSAQQGLTALHDGVDGFDFTLFSADNTLDCGIKIADVSNIGRGLAGYSHQGKVKLTALEVTSSSGKPFSLTSVSTFLDGYTGNATVHLLGYRNGNLVAESAISNVKGVSNSGGAVVFDNTGKPGFMGIDSFKISVEGAGVTAIGLKSFTASMNEAPSFVWGGTASLDMPQNTSLKLDDSLRVKDADSGQTLTWSQASAPQNGSLSYFSATAASGGDNIAPNGDVFYTPNTGFSGKDSFQIQVSDGLETATRIFSITVNESGGPTDIILSNSSVSAAALAAGNLQIGELTTKGSGTSFS